LWPVYVAGLRRGIAGCRPPERYDGRRRGERLGKVGVKTLYTESGSLWENGYCESFNGKFGD